MDDEFDPDLRDVLDIMGDGPWHVIPVDDIEAHDPDESCWCNPAYNDGVYVHHALDGRDDEWVLH